MNLRVKMKNKTTPTSPRARMHVMSPRPCSWLHCRRQQQPRPWSKHTKTEHRNKWPDNQSTQNTSMSQAGSK
jgi:hypothetical protein